MRSCMPASCNMMRAGATGCFSKKCGARAFLRSPESCKAPESEKRIACCAIRFFFGPFSSDPKQVPTPSGELTKAALNISHRLGSRGDGGVRWPLQRQQHVHDLAAVTRLLDVADLAVAAIGDAGL